MPIALPLLLIAASLLQSCGINLDDLDSETNRKAMYQEAINALNVGNCALAVDISSRLFNSKYSDNPIRMLYASSQACVTGIQFYGMLTNITNNNFATVDDIFKSMVKMFPSRTALDSNLQAAWNSQDALQSVLGPGPVISQADMINPTGFNPGSARYIDRTADSNLFLIFVAMAELGSGLNRYGYTAADDPASFGYAPAVPCAAFPCTGPLPWVTKTLVKGDTTGSACGIASSYYNLIDGIKASAAILPSNVGGTLTTMIGLLSAVIDGAASANCTSDGFTQLQCDAAIARLRYRNACTEQDAAASAAAGVIGAIDLGWI